MYIFFDNNATTPILKEVVEAMMIDLDGVPRNPSSITSFGRDGRVKIIKARKIIANYLNVYQDEVFFTSGGTESNHTMINGFYNRNPGTIITTKIEHASILESIKYTTKNVTYLEVDEGGTPTLKQIENSITSTTSFIVISGANNETGVLNSIEEISDLANFYNIPLLVDGVALLGKCIFTPLHKNIGAISFSGHKCHGPKGIGILVVRKKFNIQPIFRGGNQEMGMRAGTENLSAILGLSKAFELIDASYFTYIKTLRDYFENELKKIISYEINGLGDRISNTSNIYMPNIDANKLLINLDQNRVIVSLGSACSSGAINPSHVLLSMGYSKERALSSLRFSFSRLNTKTEIDKAIFILKKIV